MKTTFARKDLSLAVTSNGLEEYSEKRELWIKDKGISFPIRNAQTTCTDQTTRITGQSIDDHYDD